jgi:hypothetical protein
LLNLLQFGPLQEVFPEGCVYKASQWVLLSRTHALAVLGLMQRFDQRRSQSTNPGVPPLGEELFTAFGRGVRASDEMFFPCCLAVLGFIKPPPVATTNATRDVEASSSGDGGADSQPPPVGVVLRQQLTYADWRGQAANPITYTSFPAPLVQEVTGVPISITITTADGSAPGAKRARYSADSYNPGAEGPAVDATQRGAVFLRKIKFPARAAAAPGAIGSGAEASSGTGVGSGDALSQEQEKFLRGWLPFILCETGSSGDRFEHKVLTDSVQSGGVGGTEDTATAVEGWLQRAAALYTAIGRESKAKQGRGK